MTRNICVTRLSTKEVVTPSTSRLMVDHKKVIKVLKKDEAGDRHMQVVKMQARKIFGLRGASP